MQRLGYVPVTVIAVAAVSGVLAANGVRFTDVFATGGIETMFNPFVYTANMLFHDDWAHYASNMRYWLPFGVVLTLLSSNRHVLWVAIVSHALASAVGMAIGQLGVGTSTAVLAVAGATLVRATGYAMQNASMDSLQTVIAGVLVPFLAAFFLIMVFAGPSPIGHFAHFLGFLFGGAIEAMYVFDDHDSDADADERSIPKRVGR
jgi:membrane associated rhomboid family serine protease